METIVTIKKGDRLDALVRGVEGRAEQERLIEAVEDPAFKELFIRYKEALKWTHNNAKEYVLCENTDEPVLIPAMIQAFTIVAGRYKKFEDETIPFLSRMIQNSYRAGNNDFTLSPADFLESAEKLCGYIQGTEENPIRVRIIGDTGDNLAQLCQHVSMEVEGDVGRCCFSNASDSEIYASGSFEQGIGYEAERCAFKTSDIKILNQFKECVPKGNRLVFIDSADKEHVMLDYPDSRRRLE